MLLREYVSPTRLGSQGPGPGGEEDSLKKRTPWNGTGVKSDLQSAALGWRLSKERQV
jgi:hypothetical protein